MAGIVENSLTFLEGQSGSKDIKIVQDIPRDLPPVQADPIQLERVFVNIMLNSQQSIVKSGQIRIQADII